VTTNIDIPDVATGDINSPGTAFRDKVKTDTPGIVRGQALAYSGFKYPNGTDLRISPTYRMYATRWQTMMNAKGGAPTWEEKPVKSPEDGQDTYVYPGSLAWTTFDDTYFMGVDSSTILNKNYVINTTQGG
jgi:hypothetical protein